MRLLKSGEIIRIPGAKKRYKIVELLGQGGFGRAYRAEIFLEGNKQKKDVCLKVTEDQASWHRESYFGELLNKNKRAIQLYESFVLPPNTARGKMLYGVVLEFAQHGDMHSYLKRTQHPWKPERAKREVIALLKMLEQLHGGNATHRDITPKNLFIGDNFTLKLGDFGIACHNLSNTPRSLDAVNSGFAPTQLMKQVHPIWKTNDDVYQIGQILAMLISGSPDEKMTPQSISHIVCDDGLKEIIKKAIGPRQQRYKNASEMLLALQGKNTPELPPLKTIRGKNVVFSGKLAMSRFDAEIMVLQSGGNVQTSMSPKTDVLVQGSRSSAFVKKGYKEQKLLEAQRLIKKGHPLHIISETEFRRLIRKTA